MASAKAAAEATETEPEEEKSDEFPPEETRGKKRWITRLEDMTNANEEQRKLVSISLFGRAWPESAVIWEANQWKRWERYQADHEGTEEEIDTVQEFYTTWKAQA